MRHITQSDGGGIAPAGGGMRAGPEDGDLSTDRLPNVAPVGKNTRPRRRAPTKNCCWSNSEQASAALIKQMPPFLGLPELLTRKDVARLAGVSVYTVKRDVRRGLLPEIPHNGRRRRYFPAVVAAYLAGNYSEAARVHETLLAQMTNK